MADGGPAGGAGEAAVGDEGHRLAQPHAADGGGGVEHLPHPGSALGPLVADDHHVAGDDLPSVDGLDGLLLGVEDPGGAGVEHHLRGHGGALHHAALGGQVALEHGDAAVGGVGVLDGADQLGVAVDHALQVLGQGLSGAGEHARVQQALLRQLLHDGVHAARALQILHIGIPGGGKMAQVGGFGGDLVGQIQIQLDAALVGDGGQVEHGVCGAAQGHVHRLGVVEGGGGHDVPGADVFCHQLHDLHTGMLGQA